MAKGTADMIKIKDFAMGRLFWIIYESLEVKNLSQLQRWHQKTQPVTAGFEDEGGHEPQIESNL